MLNFPIAMFAIVRVLAVILLFSGVAQGATPVEITRPQAGEALQGLTQVVGSTAVEGFASAELFYGYSQDDTNTWFLLQQSDQPVQGAVIATWDTTTISDGDYRLRLVVAKADGSREEVIVDGLRVRNYSPVETETPAPTATVEGALLVGTPTAVLTPTAAASPTPAPETKNALASSEDQWRVTLAWGAAIAVGLFILMGIYSGLKHAFWRDIDG